jgi:hypothetical protein
VPLTWSSEPLTIDYGLVEFTIRSQVEFDGPNVNPYISVDARGDVTFQADLRKLRSVTLER